MIQTKIKQLVKKIIKISAFRLLLTANFLLISYVVIKIL